MLRVTSHDARALQALDYIAQGHPDILLPTDDFGVFMERGYPDGFDVYDAEAVKALLSACPHDDEDVEFFWDDRDQPLPDIALQDVWYAGYGSNLNAERFMRYMKMQGVTAQASDFDQRRAAIPHARYFAGRASQWGVGGVAYLDLEPSLTQTPVRLWQVTYEQFAHLFYAESGMTLLYPEDFPWEDALEFSSTVGNFGWYGAVLNLGQAEGLPVLTATAPCLMAERNDFADPSPKYLGVINQGREQMRSLPRTRIEPLLL